ncbi:hypothetical protein Cgig2_009215 [Carnegiea gigantea]|uniref:R13L1/DRL21-like LRR repeat region domain-containing protein n=1 Tax=Carnegiea gigantea TaxID=171969 RepID=A0A9Q1JPB6_9CARY|nr:hypothetical protein Cgig2_009215 [Carnegiea gigantea]
MPANIWKLVSLRHLDIRRATLLSHMPNEMSKLTSLQTLTSFVVGKNIGPGIQGLSQLQQIHGKFAIRRPQNVFVTREAYAVNLSNGTEVLESFEPPSDVKRLTIRNYGGTTFPKWLIVGDADYKEIGFMCLSNCRYCITLPPLGQLPFLNLKGNLPVHVPSLVERSR